MKTINITLKFGESRSELWTSSCANFIEKYTEHFLLLEGKPLTKGTLFFCNTYLEAQFVMALEKGVGLYLDLGNEEYVVATKQPFKTTFK